MNVSAAEPLSVGELELQHTELEVGGSWEPASCIPRHRVAVIVPFRDREEHLRALLSVIHPMLQRQRLQYTVFVAEQVRTDFSNMMQWGVLTCPQINREVKSTVFLN